MFKIFDLDKFNFIEFNPSLLSNDLEGWYSINIRQSRNSEIIRKIPFYIEPDKKENDVFVESTDTFKAYNWAGNFGVTILCLNGLDTYF